MTKKLPFPTVGAARALLAKARRELNGKIKSEQKLDETTKHRQAAEKGWLAAVTAGRAMLRVAGGKWMSSMGVTDHVIEIETERKTGPVVSSKLRLLAGSLHGGAFYQGNEDFCQIDFIEANFQLVDEIIQRVDEFCRHARKRAK